MASQFKIDISKVRQDARSHMAEGAVTVGNTVDVERLIEILI